MRRQFFLKGIVVMGMSIKGIHFKIVIYSPLSFFYTIFRNLGLDFNHNN